MTFFEYSDFDLGLPAVYWLTLMHAVFSKTALFKRVFALGYPAVRPTFRFCGPNLNYCSEMTISITVILDFLKNIKIEMPICGSNWAVHHPA